MAWSEPLGTIFILLLAYHNTDHWCSYSSKATLFSASVTDAKVQTRHAKTLASAAWSMETLSPPSSMPITYTCASHFTSSISGSCHTTKPSRSTGAHLALRGSNACHAYASAIFH
eukprot:3586333-Amphidinium_carterae.2